MVLIWKGWPESALIADDAFYYFTIARHWADGHGVSFDGLGETNGFHPLWLLLLRPVFGLARGDLWTPVRLALSSSVVFDLLCGWVLYRTIRTVVGQTGAAVATALWLASPYSYFLALRGMESSLNALCVLLLYATFVRLAGREQPRLDPRSVLQVGVLLAACGWARTDNLVVAGGALVGWAGWQANACSAWRTHLGWLARVAVVSAVCMSPWFAWSYSKFRSVVQVSALMKHHVVDYWGQIPWNTASIATTVQSIISSLFAPVFVPTNLLAAEEFGAASLYLVLSVILILTVTPVLWFGLRQGWLGRPDRTLKAVLVFPITYIGLHVFLFGFVGRQYATWYAHSPHALFCGLVGMAASPLLHGSKAMRGVVATWALAFIAVFAVEYVRYGSADGHGGRGPELRHRPAFEAILRQRPRGAVAGAFDAGAIGYIATAYPTITVVNLDGMVNNRVYRAYLDGRYEEYVRSTIDVALQDMGAAARFCGSDAARALQRHFGQRAPEP